MNALQKAYALIDADTQAYDDPKDTALLKAYAEKAYNNISEVQDVPETPYKTYYNGDKIWGIELLPAYGGSPAQWSAVRICQDEPDHKLDPDLNTLLLKL